MTCTAKPALAAGSDDTAPVEIVSSGSRPEMQRRGDGRPNSLGVRGRGLLLPSRCAYSPQLLARGLGGGERLPGALADRVALEFGDVASFVPAQSGVDGDNFADGSLQRLIADHQMLLWGSAKVERSPTKTCRDFPSSRFSTTRLPRFPIFVRYAYPWTRSMRTSLRESVGATVPSKP